MRRFPGAVALVAFVSLLGVACPADARTFSLSDAGHMALVDARLFAVLRDGGGLGFRAAGGAGSWATTRPTIRTSVSGTTGLGLWPLTGVVGFQVPVPLQVIT